MRRLIAFATLFTAVVSCNGSEPVGIHSEASSGTYVLQSVNGEPLPFILTSNLTNKLQLDAETLLLRADGTYLDVLTLTKVEGGVTTILRDSSAGTWSEIGTTVSFDDHTGAEPLRGTLTGTKLQIPGDGLLLVYQK